MKKLLLSLVLAVGMMNVQMVSASEEDYIPKQSFTFANGWEIETCSPLSTVIGEVTQANIYKNNVKFEDLIAGHQDNCLLPIKPCTEFSFKQVSDSKKNIVKLGDIIEFFLENTPYKNKNQTDKAKWSFSNIQLVLGILGIGFFSCGLGAHLYEYFYVNNVEN